MLCKYQLKINGQVHNLSNDSIKNWDEVNYAIKRGSYGGVLRSFSSSFQFVGQAYDLLFAEYQKSYLNADCVIIINTFEENMSYKKLHSARLDFSTLEIKGGVLSMNSFDDSIAAKLNAKKSTQYEYKVSELKESHPLHYDRLQMSSEVNWTDGGTLVENVEEKQSYVEIPKGIFDHPKQMSFPLAIMDSEIAVKHTGVPYDSLNFELVDIDNINTEPFFEALDDIEVHLEFSFDVWLEKCDSITNILLQGGIRMDNIDPDAPPMPGFFGKQLTNIRTHCEFNQNISLKKGEKLTMYLLINVSNKNKLYISDFKGFNLKYKAVGKPENVDIIKPVTLLNRLVGSICPEQNITCEIESGDDRINNAMIVAAESARGIGEAKIYTSYKKFCDWMNVVFGYVPVITENSVRFVHRDSLYLDEAPIDVNDVNEIVMSVDNSRIYSSVKVGYDKKDYDSVNGRDEFRWTNEFETGVDIKSSTLSLISPYRADAYGIEFLVEKRGEDTSDTNSDTDVFFVNAAMLNSVYYLTRGIPITGVISPDTMFNVMYSPRSIIKANERFLGMSINMLKFASSEGNSDIIIANEDERADFILTDRLFTVAELTFKSANDMKVDEKKPLRVNFWGVTYTGYLDERICKYGRYEGVKYKLLIKTIE